MARCKELCQFQPSVYFCCWMEIGLDPPAKISDVLWQHFYMGEPYSHSGLIDHLSSPVKAITDIYPEPEWFLGDSISEPSFLINDWCAHLYPDINYLTRRQETAILEGEPFGYKAISSATAFRKSQVFIKKLIIASHKTEQQARCLRVHYY